MPNRKQLEGGGAYLSSQSILATGGPVVAGVYRGGPPFTLAQTGNRQQAGSGTKHRSLLPPARSHLLRVLTTSKQHEQLKPKRPWDFPPSNHTTSSFTDPPVVKGALHLAPLESDATDLRHWRHIKENVSVQEELPYNSYTHKHPCECHPGERNGGDHLFLLKNSMGFQM